MRLTRDGCARRPPTRRGRRGRRRAWRSAARPVRAARFAVDPARHLGIAHRRAGAGPRPAVPASAWRGAAASRRRRAGLQQIGRWAACARRRRRGHGTKASPSATPSRAWRCRARHARLAALDEYQHGLGRDAQHRRAGERVQIGRGTGDARQRAGAAGRLTSRASGRAWRRARQKRPAARGLQHQFGVGAEVERAAVGEFGRTRRASGPVRTMSSSRTRRPSATAKRCASRTTLASPSAMVTMPIEGRRAPGGQGPRRAKSGAWEGEALHRDSMRHAARDEVSLRAGRCPPSSRMGTALPWGRFW